MWQSLTSKKIHITRTTCQCGPTLCSHHKYVAVSHLKKKQNITRNTCQCGPTLCSHPNMWQSLTSKKIHIARTTCQCELTLCSHHKYVAVSHLQKITHWQNYISMWTDTVLSPQICGSLPPPKKLHIARTTCRRRRKLYFNNLLHVHQHTSMKYMIYDTVGY